MTENYRAALKLVARTESVFHDPVYSSKAMEALIDQIRQGQLKPDQSVVFVYAGGVAAIFAYAEDLLPE